MFLEQLRRRNNQLIAQALKHYQDGHILPNSYVIDLEMVERNAELIVEAAKKYGVIPFAMTKQLGRNPVIGHRLVKAGIEKMVAVDPWEAIILAEAGLKLGNVGHLVQVPEKMLNQVVAYRPEVMTVFSYEKAKSLNRVAAEQGIIQPILLRPVSSQDWIYEGQRGGIVESRWLEEVAQIKKLRALKIIGLTSFPCFLYQTKTGKIEITENMATLKRAKGIMEKKLELDLIHINTPSANTSSTMDLIAEQGGTHCEPGHALTGTTPLHAVQDQPERVAMLYITEVSHLFKKRAYTFFGGHYRRSNMRRVAVYSRTGQFKTILPVDDMDSESIDYYGSFKAEGLVEMGDICIYAFRSQIFTTRSQVVLLDGVSTGESKVEGIYDSQGRRL